VPSSGGDHIELTEHARRWVETLWGPLAEEGGALLARESTANLHVLARFMDAVVPLHQRHVARLRALLETGAPGHRSTRLRGGLSPAALRRVQVFIEANLDQDIRLRDLAARAGVSTFHFARGFRTSMGTTPRAFVESRRVERAKELLRHTEIPLGQIAAEVGLGTQSRFTTVFRNHTGVTPGAYRRGVR
jgi:AraC family transcriptional regulator